MPAFTWLPANRATPEDVEAVFATAARPTSGLVGAVIWDEASVGLVQVFLGADYEVVTSPTLRRRVVRRPVAVQTPPSESPRGA